jgi:VanZ family protein
MAAEPPTVELPLVDISRLAGLSRPLLIVAIAALASLVVFVELPARPYLLHLVQKLGHPGVFGLISILVLALQLRPGVQGRPWREYAIALATAITIGAATEVGQVFTHRDPAVRDVGLDTLGALCALSLSAAFDRRVWGDRANGFAVHLACAALGLAIGIGLLVPFGYGVLAYAKRAYNFPVLLKADTVLDRYFVARGHFTAETVPADGTDGPRQVLRVLLSQRRYDGISIFEPSPDWRGFKELEIAVENPGTQPLELTVRIDDRLHNGSFDDRYNGAFRVAAGARRLIEIPLADIEAAPRGRRFDLEHVGFIAIFRADAGAPEAFLLERMALR